MLRVGRRKLEPPGQHRVDDDPVAIEIDLEELPVATDRRDGLPDECAELGRSAASNASATTVRSGSSGTAADRSRLLPVESLC
jgi:hypothetical protein